MKKFFLVFVIFALAAVSVNGLSLDVENPADVPVSTTEAYVDEETLKAQYRKDAKEAGLKDSQVEPTAHLLWMINSIDKPAVQLSIIANHCEMLNDDGIMFPVIEKNTSDLANASTAEKIQLYSDIGSESKVAAIKAMKNICVLFLNQEERKKIEGWAKEAGILEEEIQTAVDMEMRLQLTTSNRIRGQIVQRHSEQFGKNQYVLEPSLSKSEMETLKSLKTDDYIGNIEFWGRKYNHSSGADRIKALKNLFVTVWAGRVVLNRENNARALKFN